MLILGGVAIPIFGEKSMRESLPTGNGKNLPQAQIEGKSNFLIAPQPIHPESLALLKKAYRLKTEGRLEEAQKIARKATYYTPGMEIPDWAKRNKQPDPFFPPPSKREIVLAEANRLLDSRLTDALKELLAENPSDRTVRLLLLQLAQIEGSQKEAEFHKNILGSLSNSEVEPWFDWITFLAGFTSLFIFWQLCCLFREIHKE